MVRKLLMWQCLSFLRMDPVLPRWRRVLLSLLMRMHSWVVSVPSSEVVLFEAPRLGRRRSSASRISLHAYSQKIHAKSYKSDICISANGATYLIKARDAASNGICKPRKKGTKKLLQVVQMQPKRFFANGSCDTASLFTKRGLKRFNQDAMLVLENFAARSDTVFCGVFDGHGPDGHLVARNVRDLLPDKLLGCWHALQATTSAYETSKAQQRDHELPLSACGDDHLISTWKESFLKAYKLVDGELLVNERVDCIFSGTTAVTLVKQGSHLFVGHVGDSRAVLGMIGQDNSVTALQLTVDLKPNLPKEAERIRRHRGRVFALRNEPKVKRVWMPSEDAPGLAMARALGDYCLKNFGVISEPVITYRQLTEQDRFVVLATDGVWDVLSNDQVTEIVAFTADKSHAAKAVVEAAIRAWRLKYSTSKTDDCAVVCLFLDENDPNFA